MFTDDVVLLTNLFEQFGVLLVGEQKFGVVVCRSISQNILEDVVVAELRSDVVDRLRNVSADLSHFVKRWQPLEFWLIVKVYLLFFLVLFAL